MWLVPDPACGSVPSSIPHPHPGCWGPSRGGPGDFLHLPSRPTCLCPQLFRGVPPSANRLGQNVWFLLQCSMNLLFNSTGRCGYFSNYQSLLQVGFFTAPCMPVLQPKTTALLEGKYAGPSQIFRDKPHTIPDSTQDAQTRPVSWVTCRHFRCVTSLLPRISLWGVLCARFTDTALFSLTMTGCGAAFDWQQEGRGEADLPTQISFWPMTMVSLPTPISSWGK